MILGALMQIIQVIGIFVPLTGVISLLKGEQNKVSTYLMLTNVGCLVMNCGYLLLIRSSTYEEALMAFKVEYLGNLWFYFFFGLFVMSFLLKKTPQWLFDFWAFLEAFGFICLLNNNLNHVLFEKISFHTNGSWKVHYMQIELGPLYMIRYGFICVVLVCAEGWTVWRMFQTKIEEEKHKLARLAGAEFVLVISLILMLVYRFDFDLVPIFASLAILSIILSVIRGEFFGIADMGREWAFEQMEEAVIIVDKLHGFLEANAYARRIFPQLNEHEEKTRVPEEIYQIFVDDKDELQIGKKYYEKKTSVIHNDKKVVGYSLMLVDITKQRLLMDELKEEKNRADDANQAKSIFLSNMSHEIRTPMNAIVGMTEILLRRQLPAQDAEYLHNIKNSGNALLTIINDILDFSKIESGKMEIVQEAYEPMSMFSDLSMIFLNRIGNKKIELLFDIDKELPAKLYGDELRIRQVIINLVNNAIKFTDVGSVKLTVKVVELDGDVVKLSYSIKDTGQGIKTEDLDKLFGSFQQIDVKKNRYKEGTGLGLSISKQLVEMMGGSIQVTSEYGNGSEFIIIIPQKIMDSQKAAQIHTDIPVSISGCMKDAGYLEVLRNLAFDYDLPYIECSELLQEGKYPDFFFVDDIDVIPDAFKEIHKNGRMTICLLQNPMTDHTWGYDVSIINKPLYSLNFCQTINGEVIEHTSSKDNVLNFTAPEARIIIVDDNRMNLKVALGLLEPLKMQMDTAEDGKQALAMIKDKHYDLIFMDHMMPVMDGIETVERLRQMEGDYYKQVPVIALTANAVAEAREQFIEAGMNDFLSKPIKMKEICAAIKQWLPAEYIVAEDGGIQENICDEQLPIIEGLNVAEGIQNSGTKELFLSLLGDYYKLIDMKSVKLEKCLADGLIRDYTIEVHALKNTSRMIGAMELSELFYQMEQYGNAENIDALLKETPRVLELYRSYKEVLKPYARIQEGAKKSVPKKELMDALSQLQEAMDNFDLDRADEVMEQLEELQFPQECEQMLDDLRAYVADVAMEEVIEVAGKLIQEIEKMQEDK